MNAAHLHLMLNHIPIVGGLIATILLAVAVVLRRDEVGRIALAMFVGIALTTVPVYLSGDPAEDMVEQLAGVDADAIDAHEDIAVYAFVGMGCTGVLALAGLWLFSRRAIPRWFAVVSLVAALLATGVVMLTAYEGRRIRHPEVDTQVVPGP